MYASPPNARHWTNEDQDWVQFATMICLLTYWKGEEENFDAVFTDPVYEAMNDEEPRSFKEILGNPVISSMLQGEQLLNVCVCVCDQSQRIC